MADNSISVEGGLLPADLLEQIATGDTQGQREADFQVEGSARLTATMESAFSGVRKHWESYRRGLERSSDAAARTRITRQRWMANLADELGYDELRRPSASLQAGERRYRIYATAGESDDAPPFHVVGSDQELDRRSERNRRSPHALVQDYLNNSDALWGIVANGDKLRLLRDSTLFTRPTYIEFDIKSIIEGNQYAAFTQMYRLLHRTRLPADGQPPDDCLLERYYQDGLDSHSRVRERLRDGVERALRTLGNGFLQHRSSDALRQRIAVEGLSALSADEYYRQLLRLVYRLLFLMVSEERGLLAGATDEEHRLYGIYQRYYSVSQLRARADKQIADDGHRDLWEGLKQTFLIFRTDENASAFGMQALDGELFSESACADLESAACANHILLRAMRDLSTFWDEGETTGRRGRRQTRSGVRRRVNYAAIDVEEFGSVYESLLEFQPKFTINGMPAFDLVTGSERKQTGSYYTPPELVNELIESALVPVIRERMASARSDDDKASALLSLKVCDPAAGSGHFLLAAARRIATEVARLRTGEAEPTPEAYREAMRDTVRHCIYGVDKNPLAVDLCKVALWIEGHALGKPLNFLDHRIRCGDSLVGVMGEEMLHAGIPNDAYKAVTGDDRPTVNEYRKRNRAELRSGGVQLSLGGDPDNLAADFIALGGLAENSVEDIQRKKARFNNMRGPGSNWWRQKAACDLWVAPFFMPKHPDAHEVPTTGDLKRHMLTNSAHATLIGKAVEISEHRQFFHWHLEFPEVFDDGGFDVVLGNPPWERIKLQQKEFFATRDDAIANAPNKAARNRLIAEMRRANPALTAEFDAAVHDSDATSVFVRGSGRFSLTGRGDVNTYSIFTETARNLLAPNGRAGMIVPTAIAIGDTTKDFFADLIRRRSLVRLFDFENRNGIFQGVHRSYRFCLLTLGGEEQFTTTAEFAFFLHRPAQLRNDDSRFTMAPADFTLFNPNTGNCPVFHSRRDMDINRKLYQRAGVLWKEAKPGQEEVNPWGVKFQRMFDMSNDSHLFRTREQLDADGWRLAGNIFVKGDERWLPLYEAKLFHQYDHRFATFEGVPASKRFQQGAPTIESSAEEKRDVNAVVLPRYWVAEDEVQNRFDQRNLTPVRRQPQASAAGVSRRRQPQASAAGVSAPTSSRHARTVGAQLVIRNLTNSTNQRTVITTKLPNYGLGNSATTITVG